MLKYDIKIIILFGESLTGKEKILYWLLNNGYPELAALSNSIQTNEEAFDWLIKNGYHQYAALSNAIDKDEKAKKWLADNNFKFLYYLAEASLGNREAIEWFREKKLFAFIVISQKIKALKEQQEINYDDIHKIHF